jgi:hypothetical protein
MANNEYTENKFWEMAILPTEELSREYTIEFSNVLFRSTDCQSEMLVAKVDEHFGPSC